MAKFPFKFIHLFICWCSAVTYQNPFQLEGRVPISIVGTVMILLTGHFEVSRVSYSSCVSSNAVSELLSKVFWQRPSVLFTLVYISGDL